MALKDELKSQVDDLLSQLTTSVKGMDDESKQMLVAAFSNDIIGVLDDITDSGKQMYQKFVDDEHKTQLAMGGIIEPVTVQQDSPVPEGEPPIEEGAEPVPGEEEVPPEGQPLPEEEMATKEVASIFERIKKLPATERKAVRKAAGRLATAMDVSDKLKKLEGIPEDEWDKATSEELIA